MAQSPLLTIDSAGHAETVVIDGKSYALTDYDSLGIVEAHHVRRTGERLEELAKKATELTDEEVEEMDRISTELFNMIAGEIPEDVRAKLRYGARQRLVTRYFLAWGVAVRADSASGQEPEDGPQATSPDSSGSTEEAPTSG